MNIPDGIFYTKEHEWVKIDGAKATVGITDYAQSHLGDITYVELPGKGKAVKQFGALASVESVKAASDIYSPMSGTVLDVNTNLVSAPENINKSPYADGWIAVIELKDVAEKKNLMDSKAYEEHLKQLR